MRNGSHERHRLGQGAKPTVIKEWSIPTCHQALAYFEDAEPQPMPRLLTSVEWADVRAYCKAAARWLARRLSGLQG